MTTASPPMPAVAPASPVVAPAGAALAPATPPAAGQTAAAAPVAQAAPTAAVADIHAVAAAIAAAPDPAAELSHLVLAVAAASTSAARQGSVLSTVGDTCRTMLRTVRTALLASVIDAAHPAGRPGIYPGFTVTEKAGARSISYTDLERSHPDVYAELVRIGAPSLVVSYTG